LSRMTESILEARRQGIVLRTNFIVGFPEETRRDVFQTTKYALMLAIRGVDEVSMNVYSPYPGSELFDDMVRAGKVRLDDSYFIRLMSNYTDYTKTDLITFNAEMSARQLAIWRAAFMFTGYALGYLLYPSRIVRTIKNVFLDSHEAATVFE